MDKKIIYILLMVAVTAVAFYPSLLNGFVDLDDPHYVFNNDLIKSFSWQNINKIYTSGFVGCYCPLPMLTYAVEYYFFKLNPFYFHLSNYFLHILAALLVFYLIYLLSGSPRAALIAGLLFGIHPMHVESVAWISERKDLLCAVFYLAGLVTYIKYIKSSSAPLRVRYYFCCFICTLLALLSKPMAVSMPFVFFLLDYFYERRFGVISFLEKIPFLIMAIVFGVINLHFESMTGATHLKADLIVKAYFLCKAIPFYLAKLAAPLNLSAMYLYHDLSARHIAEIKYYAAILAALAALIVFSGRYTRKIIFGSLFFIITILPVLKIIPAGDSFAQDRYMYLPSIGIFYMVSIFFDKALFGSRMAKAVKFILLLFLGAAIVWFFVLTWQRCAVWKDTESLYNDILEKYPDRPQLYNDMGAFFAYKGDYDKAIKCFNVALMFKPDYSQARRNLAIAKIGLLNKMGLIKE